MTKTPSLRRGDLRSDVGGSLHVGDYTHSLPGRVFEKVCLSTGGGECYWTGRA